MELLNKLLFNESYIDKIKKSALPVVLYGMGNGAEKIIKYLIENKIEISAVFASDNFVRGQRFSGFNVETLDDIKRKFDDFIIVSAFALEGNRAGLLFDLADKHRLFAPNLPPYGNGCIDKEFIVKNINRINNIYEKLCDDVSRRLYISHLQYCITGEVEHIKNYNTDPPEGYHNHGKTHIDIGAYDGDTAVEYYKANKNGGQIIALEPDKNTFKKLLKNTEGIPGVRCINAAAWDSNGTAGIYGSGRGSSIEGVSEENVKTLTVDSFCGWETINKQGLEIGSIKIDGEGAEDKILKGAVNTIYCCRPSICISVYHRTGDLLDLPEYLLYHNPSYKLYFRRKKYIPAFDTVIYAING